MGLAGAKEVCNPGVTGMEERWGYQCAGARFLGICGSYFSVDYLSTAVAGISGSRDAEFNRHFVRCSDVDPHLHNLKKL